MTVSKEVEEILEDDELDIDLEDEELDEEDVEQEEDPETDPAEDTAKEEPAGTIRVKYNSEEKDLPMAEAIAYVQKGMNYDKVQSQLETLEKGGAKDALELVTGLAEENNMTVQEYIEYAAGNLSTASESAQLRQIMKENPELPEPIAKELAKGRAARKAEAIKAAKAEREQAPWDELAREYPELKTADQLPEDVRAAVAAGKSPLLAMREHDLAEARAKLAEHEQSGKAKEKNEQNKQSAIGSAKGTAKNKPDPVLEALLEDD